MIILKRTIVFGTPGVKIYQDGQLKFIGVDRDEIVGVLERSFKVENAGRLVDAVPIHGKISIYEDRESS